MISFRQRTHIEKVFLSTRLTAVNFEGDGRVIGAQNYDQTVEGEKKVLNDQMVPSDDVNTASELKKETIERTNGREKALIRGKNTD